MTSHDLHEPNPHDSEPEPDTPEQMKSAARGRDDPDPPEEQPRPRGAVHRGMVSLLRRSKEWLTKLLQQLAALPEISPDGTVEVLPTEVWPLDEEGRWRELRADMVTRTWPNKAPTRKTLRKIRTSDCIGSLIELQMWIDDTKCTRWQEFALVYRSTLGQHIILVVFTFDDEVAEWVLSEIQPTIQFMQIVVVTPSTVPWLDVIDPVEEPEAVLLHAMLHAQDPENPDHVALVAGALHALNAFEDEDAVLYRQMLLAHLEEELIMNAAKAARLTDEYEQEYEPTPRELKSFLHMRGVRMGRAEGRAEAVIQILRHRGLALDLALESTILGCRDPERVRTWLTRAFEVEQASDLLDT